MKKIMLLMMFAFLSACSNNSAKDSDAKVIEVTDATSSNINGSVLEDSVAGIIASEDVYIDNIDVKSFYDSGVDFVIYFEFDDYELDAKTTQTVIQHANFMLNNPNISLRLEGHADERGTREYNLALGENRALGVKEILDLYDLKNQIEVVSFGEEMPFIDESNEESWSKNRRVKFIYK